MRAGQLRQRITLQKLGPRADDGKAGGSQSPVDVTTVWAKVEPLAGNELFEAQRFNPNLSHKVGIRYFPGVKPSWRVKYGKQEFDIKTVIDVDERHSEMVLMCEKQVTW